MAIASNTYFMSFPLEKKVINKKTAKVIRLPNFLYDKFSSINLIALFEKLKYTDFRINLL